MELEDLSRLASLGVLGRDLGIGVPVFLIRTMTVWTVALGMQSFEEALVLALDDCAFGISESIDRMYICKSKKE